MWKPFCGISIIFNHINLVFEFLHCKIIDHNTYHFHFVYFKIYILCCFSLNPEEQHPEAHSRNTTVPGNIIKTIKELPLSILSFFIIPIKHGMNSHIQQGWWLELPTQLASSARHNNYKTLKITNIIFSFLTSYSNLNIFPFWWVQS